MSTRRQRGQRPEQGWTVVVALVAVTPHLMALADVQGWVATALSIPVLLLVLVAFLGVVAYGISGGG